MFGNQNFGYQIDSNLKEEIARKKLSEVSEKYGLDIDDVEVEYDSTLPYNIMGRTSSSKYFDDSPKITVGESFLQASEPEKLKTILHEGIHVKQAKNEIDDWLEDEFNASNNFIREVEKSSDFRYEDDLEGITEVLTDTLLPFDVGTGYPYQKRKKEAELEAKGLDAEKELLDNSPIQSDYTSNLYSVEEYPIYSFVDVADYLREVEDYFAEQLDNVLGNSFQSANPGFEFLKKYEV